MLRDNQRRATTARLIFLLLAFDTGGLLLLSILGQLLPGWADAVSAVSHHLTAAIYYFYASLSFCYIGLVVASYVTLIMWLRRAYYNLHQLPTIHPEYSDGWAAGAWFVPFINFVRPFSIVREVWQDTQRAALGRIVEPSTLLGWWWAAFILKLVLARISWYIGNHGDSVLTQEDLLGTALDAGGQFIAALFTWYVIGRCAKFEEQLAIRQQIDQLGQPAPEASPELSAEQSDYWQPEGY